jgi:cyclopropane fatty-acyl-phospholipid synthase-like methyltransferase
MKVPYGRSLLRYFSPERRMREDWDLRAQSNARYYVDCGHAATDETFWSSGEEDLRAHVLRDLEVGPAASVLEIGCGIGRLLRPVSRQVVLARDGRKGAVTPTS